MATTHDSDATPGTLKAALILWMALMAGLLGYSIATADATAADDHGTAESSESHGEEPKEGEGDGHGSPGAASPGSPAASPASTESPH